MHEEAALHPRRLDAGSCYLEVYSCSNLLTLETVASEMCPSLGVHECGPIALVQAYVPHGVADMAGWLFTRWPGGYFSVVRRPKLDYSVGTAFGWRMRTGHGVGDPRQANRDGQVGPGSTSERPEEFWRILVENSLDMVMIAGPDNVVRYASPSVEPVLGYRPGEYVGVDFAGLIHPDDAERMLSEIDGASREPGLHGIKTARYRHKDGSWRWIEGVASSNMLDHPAFGGMIYYGRGT